MQNITSQAIDVLEQNRTMLDSRQIQAKYVDSNFSKGKQDYNLSLHEYYIRVLAQLQLNSLLRILSKYGREF